MLFVYLGSMFKERNKQEEGKGIQLIICYHYSISIQRGIKCGFLQLNRQCSWAVSCSQILTVLEKMIQRVITRRAGGIANPQHS